MRNQENVSKSQEKTHSIEPDDDSRILITRQVLKNKFYEV